jgi:hypothetical protein
MKRLLAIPFLLSCLPGSVLHAQGATAMVAYDTFWRLDVNARLERFPSLAPTNQAALLREQVARWRRAHADRLTREQDQLLGEVGEFIRPELFDSSLHDDSVKTAFMALQERASRAFTLQELSEFNTIYSPYLPPQP